MFDIFLMYIYILQKIINRPQTNLCCQIRLHNKQLYTKNDNAMEMKVTVNIG